MFITTANWLDPIPAVLCDRMEIIRLPGYTDIEKLAIARIHLIPKQLDNHGLSQSKLTITKKAIQALIDGYTREAGLRNLEREIASVARKVARRVASGYKKKITVDDKDIARLLGPQRFVREALARQGKIGVVPGLAYTSVGGELLFIEATSMPGKKEMIPPSCGQMPVTLVSNRSCSRPGRSISMFPLAPRPKTVPRLESPC
jgi:ATP-dependent Lon protease